MKLMLGLHYLSTDHQIVDNNNFISYAVRDTRAYAHGLRKLGLAFLGGHEVTSLSSYLFII